MALKSIVFKANVNVADIDRGHYGEHALTLARHPSETDERMMVRLLAFASQADEALSFCKGLSDQDEPDLWRKDLTGAIDLWIEAGQPDERRLRHACGRARQVVVYCYGHAADIWWKNQSSRLERLGNLTVIRLPVGGTQALAKLAERNMQLQCTIQDGQQMWSADDAMVQIDPVIWKSA